MATETTSSKSSAGRKRTRTDQQPPAWANELVIKYQSNIAHAFLLHGNVPDYVGGLAGQSLKNYLIESFSTRDIVVCWDRASGFTLPTAPMRQRFIDIAGIPLAGPSSSASATVRSGGLASGLNRAAATTTGSDLAAILEKIRKPEDALDILSRVLHWRPPRKSSGEDPEPFRVAVILDYAESVAPATEAAASEIDRTTLVTLNSWGRDRAIGDREHIIVLIAGDLHDLNERLRRSSARWEHIEVPFPDLSERQAFIESLLASDTDMRLAENLSAQEMARLTTGLRYIDLEDILLRASFQQQAVDRALIKQRKDEIMRSEFADVLRIAEVESGFDQIGGLEEVKHDLRETVVAPMRAGELRLVPQGILLMGPAGTGKTRLAKALAKESGVTFVELDLSKIFSKWVGDTERRLERALEAIVAWRPCIVFVDEIDQSIGRGESGDSGVSNRVFKRLMEVMADTTLRGHVLWICASVTGETPVLVRQQGQTRLVPIGEIVDAYFSRIDEEGEVVSPDLETLAVLPDHRVGWSRVQSVYRHMVDKVYDIHYGSGNAKITTTGNHSVFVLDEEAHLVPRFVSDLVPGDLLVIPAQSSGMRESSIVLNMADSKTIEARERLEAILAMAREHSQSKVAAHFGINQTLVSQYTRQTTQPRGLGAAMPHPTVLLDEDFAWFLGLFTAEGYARKEVCIPLGEQEHDLIYRAEQIMTEKFGLAVNHRIVNGAHHLIIHSVPLARRLKELVGTNARNKHIPSTLWSAERNIALAYIRGWIDGDGSTDSQDHIALVTVNKSLAYQGLWLLRLNGIAARIEETSTPERQIRADQILEAIAVYRLHITGSENPWAKRARHQQNGAHDKRVPVALLKTVYQRLQPYGHRGQRPHAYSYLSDPSRELVNRTSACTLLQWIHENRRKDDPMYQRILPFVFGDLGVSPVRHIEQRAYNGLVYDFCGCDNECFIGGEMPVMLHNTNRADLLDTALLRPGRLDKKIPILAPDGEERSAILAVLTRAGFDGTPEKDFPTPEQYADLARPMADYTGAEIEGIVGKAVQLRARNRQLSILEALQQAYARIIPTTQNIGLMTRLALLYCNDLDLVPAEHRELAKALRHPGARAELLEEQEETELSPRRPRRRDW
jgi:SpoVK/Ycf46/Vps4 family AAA+-type ATPase